MKVLLTNRLLSFIFCLTFVTNLTGEIQAAVAPVAVQVPKTTAWRGQRVPIFVELRASGSFAGTASFDLPNLPGAILLKIGSPIISSQQIDGESWFIQTHEFALFSQQTGGISIPSFPVHFTSHEGFTGPTRETTARTPELKLTIKRPPGSEKIAFLITTEALEISESWDPAPGPAQVGTLFKRTIVQRAPQLSGMTLAPVPASEPDGFRVYPGHPEINDHLERGDFLGTRRETITYLVSQAGTLTLPALTYQWWNPKTETLQTTTLPAASVEISAAPESTPSGTVTTVRRIWFWPLIAVLVVGLGVWQDSRLAGWGIQFWKKMNPPDQVAARKLLHACRQNDALAAEAAWFAWRNTQKPSFQTSPELHSAHLELQRQLFGPQSASRPPAWQGHALAGAFKKHLTSQQTQTDHKSQPTLASLNP